MQIKDCPNLDSITSKRFIFWGHGGKVPKRVQKRATRYLLEQQYKIQFSRKLYKKVAPHMTFTNIKKTGLKWRYGVRITEIDIHAIRDIISQAKPKKIIRSIIKKIILLPSSLISTATLCYALFFGPLFHLSPIKFGFNSKNSDEMSIFYHNADDLQKFGDINKMIQTTERFHNLYFKNHLQIFICSNQAEFRRYTSINTAGATMSIGTEGIYLSISKSKNRNIRDILRHELSHALLYHNTSEFDEFYLPRWLLEGIAVYYANRNDYFTKKQIGEKVRAGHFVYFKDYADYFDMRWPKQYIEEMSEEWRYKFMYAQFGFFIEDLIQTSGKRKFWSFVKRVLSDQNTEKHFKDIFGTSLETYTENFKKELEQY